MVKFSKGGRVYDYPNKAVDSNFITKNIRDDFLKFCKEKKINKSKLIEEFYRTILLRFRDNSLNRAEGYVTMKICSTD